VLKTLGAGAMGEVFLARDDLLARDVAVKTLRPLVLGEDAAEAFRARFLNEARAVAALAHPHVVRVFDLGFEGEAPYLVMERVGGSSLKDRHASGRPLSIAEVRMLGIQLARALEAAHAQGIVHRDVKPANVLEADPGMWKLADFGVAHVPDSSLTMTGQFIGSPAYSAPEALLAGEFGPATDIYGVGATLYEALGGQTLYGAPRNASTASLARGSAPQLTALRRPDVPTDLAGIIEATLSHDPAARPSAAQLATALAGGTDPAVTTPIAATAATPVAEAPLVAALARVPLVAALRKPGRSRWVVGGIAAAALILGLTLVLSASSGEADRGRPATSLFDPPPAEQSRDPWRQPSARQPSRERQKRWQKAQQKLDEGKLDDAARELEKLLDRDPDDQEARQLLEQIADFEAGRWREDG
jgi:serine/threonine-protein kinase